jgi:hypothetical protein
MLDELADVREDEELAAEEAKAMTTVVVDVWVAVMVDFEFEVAATLDVTSVVLSLATEDVRVVPEVSPATTVVTVVVTG